MKTAGTIMESEKPLSAQEVAMGLKEALKVGTDTAVAVLNKTNGYYMDKVVKIDLPPQVSEVVTHARKVPGLDKLIEDVVLQINRSAEDAAKQAAPVFKQAITQMTIADAWAILRGENNAATLYLKDNTSSQLSAMYTPIMQKSLNKPIVGNVSAQKSWNEITSKWNGFANSIAGRIAGVKAIEIELDEYVTQQALNGLFIKVAEQEEEIRTNTNARVTDLLEKVFSRQNQQQ
jgi:uncharacterized protein YunC (DUF1805 family)